MNPYLPKMDRNAEPYRYMQHGCCRTAYAFMRERNELGTHRVCGWCAVSVKIHESGRSVADVPRLERMQLGSEIWAERRKAKDAPAS